jgi:hypothetical protein
MALAGADESFADVEDIAEQAFKLSPQRFGWRTKPYPSDKTVVQAIADLEAKHAKDELTRRGVRDQADKMATRRLTTAGRDAARKVAEKFAGKNFADLRSGMAHIQAPGSEAPKPKPAERRRAQGDLLELHRHAAFQAWAENGDMGTIERWQLYDALRCLPDAPWQTVQLEKDRLTGLAEQWADADVLAFLNDLTKALDDPSRQ